MIRTLRSDSGTAGGQPAVENNHQRAVVRKSETVLPVRIHSGPPRGPYCLPKFCGWRKSAPRRRDFLGKAHRRAQFSADLGRLSALSAKQSVVFRHNLEIAENRRETRRLRSGGLLRFPSNVNLIGKRWPRVKRALISPYEASPAWNLSLRSGDVSGIRAVSQLCALSLLALP